MAHGPQETGELDLLDHWGYYFCAVVLLQRPDIYQHTVPVIYSDCNLRIQSMEKQLEQQHTDCIKVVLYGPESTGKTTLAKELAAHYNTEWVPEFSRDYLQEKWNREQQICGMDDILPIAAGQMQMENRLLEKANKVLICDTNLLETVVYSQAYFNGFCEPLLLKQALKADYHMYFLTYIDVPWVKDDLRDKPHQRDLMFDKFKKSLDHYEKPYTILKGDFRERFQTAVKMIDELIKEKEIGV